MEWYFFFPKRGRRTNWGNSRWLRCSGAGKHKLQALEQNNSFTILLQFHSYSLKSLHPPKRNHGLLKIKLIVMDGRSYYFWPHWLEMTTLLEYSCWGKNSWLKKTSGFLWLKLHIIHGQELARPIKGWCQVEWQPGRLMGCLFIMYNLRTALFCPMTEAPGCC